MSYQSPRKLASGDIITAADWNAVVDGVDYWRNTHQDALAKPEPASTPQPGMVGLAVMAAAASASQVPISRRSLLGLWRRKA